ncbi:MAG: GAF domain-containing sensor histidine kinase, partial [Roseiflexaceae bacterium]
MALLALGLLLSSWNTTLPLPSVFAALAHPAFATVGALIAARRPAHPIGWLFCAIALELNLGIFADQYAQYTLVTAPGALPGGVWMAWLGSWVIDPAWAGMVPLLLLLFPTGRLPSQRWRPVAWCIIGLNAAVILAQPFAPGPFEKVPSVSNPLGIAPAQDILRVIKSLLPLLFGAIIAAAAAVVVRFRRAQGEERQQLKWVAYAAALMITGLGVVYLITHSVNNPAVELSADVLAALLFATFPIAVGVAILKYQLYSIDLIIKRTLVYTTLTACVVGIYVLVVGYLGAVFRSNGNLIISLVATGIVAVLFQPLRDLLQRGIYRLLYGLRDEPYVVLAGLGQRLQATLDPDAVLFTIVATVREALKLSYAAIEVQEGSALALAAASGSPPAQAALRLPLVHQGEPVGTLLIAPRGRDDTLTPADLRLLDDLTHQVGIIVHTVRLTDDLRTLTRDLQRSREQLVLAREEERRRLRRDLHDDLAPTLAGLAFTASTARDLVATDPAAATALLDDLHAGIRAGVGEIRRLVYDLRPPALDEFGLVAAVRERAAQYSDQARADAKASLHVDVEAPERLPPLPAAVEVAAYRLIQEALINVVRHAQARTCHIRIALTDGLQVEVLDDGVGL